MIRVFLFAAALIALQATPAHAGPVAAIFSWISGVLAGGGVAAILMRIALSIGASLLSQAIQKKLQKRPEISVQFDIAVGDDTPLNFVVGDYATAGKRKYIGSWGPNTRYITEVIEVSCLPQPGQPAVWVNDEPGDVIWSETETYSDRVLSGYEEVLVQVGGSEGYEELQRRPIYSPRSFVLGHPLSNYQNGGRKIWIKWVDGSQTEADPLLMTVFADDPDYPWTAPMVGTGKSYAIITTLYDSKTLTSYPSYLIQPPPLPMYDPRLDSTAGGIGPHRWGDRATYAPSRNPAVIAYNLCRGVYFGSEWIYGGRNLDAWRLPFAEWVAAMNACDDPVDLDGGGTEPAYRCGVEIKADMEPLSVIEEIGRAANMRFAEVGGMIKPVVGLPGASVFTISDDDIIITEDQSFRPFAPVLETFNALSATYPEPAEKWASKDAPEYIDSEATADDGGRYLPTSTTFAACPYARQVQRLMRAQLRDYRRMRIHQFHLPPDAYKLEPIVDTITWNSARNGYVGKKFVIESIAKLPGMNVSVSLREVEPGDQDWSSAFEKPVQITPPVIVPPWILDVRDFAVVPATVTDATDQARRPGIRVSVAGGEIGVTEVRIRIRKAGGTDPEFEISRAYAEPWAWVITEGILPDAAYEVSVALISEIGDLSWWSEWESVTAPDVRLSLVDLAPDLSHLVTDAQERLNLAVPRVVDLSRQVDTVAQRLAEVSLRLHQTQGQVADAGLYLDPETGKARLEGFTRVDGVLTQLGLTLDAVQGQLTLFATQSDVSTAISEALLDPTQIPLIDDLVAQVTALEISLDTVEAAITLAATKIELEAEAARISTAEAEIDALEAAIALRVEQATFDDLEARTTNVELELGAFDGAAFQLSLADIRQLRAADETTAATLLGKMLADHQNALRLPADLAFVRQDMRALVDEDRAAIAQVRTDLGTAFGNAEALIGQEASARAAADEALATVSNALAARLDDAEAGIEGNAEATSVLQTRVTDAEDGLTAQASAIDALSTTVGEVSAEVTTQGAAIATQEGRAEASFVLRARAGGAAGEVEVVAATDPTGAAASEVVIRSDRFRFEGDLAEFLGAVKVDTLQIADRAVTVPVHAQFYTVHVLSSPSDWTDIGFVTIGRAAGVPTQIEFGGQLDGIAPFTIGAGAVASFELFRGSTLIAGNMAQVTGFQGARTSFQFMAEDADLTGGTVTYTVRARRLSTAPHDRTPRAFLIFARATQLKR